MGLMKQYSLLYVYYIFGGYATRYPDIRDVWTHMIDELS